MPQASPLLVRAPPNPHIYAAQATVEGNPPRGKSRDVVAGSRWIEFGTIAEGAVFRPRCTVMTVEAINISEAYIVVRDGRWVGFWLPYEKGFVPLENVTSIQLQREEE